MSHVVKKGTRFYRVDRYIYRIFCFYSSVMEDDAVAYPPPAVELVVTSVKRAHSKDPLGAYPGPSEVVIATPGSSYHGGGLAAFLGGTAGVTRPGGSVHGGRGPAGSLHADGLMERLQPLAESQVKRTLLVLRARFVSFSGVHVPYPLSLDLLALPPWTSRLLLRSHPTTPPRIVGSLLPSSSPKSFS